MAVTPEHPPVRTARGDGRTVLPPAAYASAYTYVGIEHIMTTEINLPGAVGGELEIHSYPETRGITLGVGVHICHRMVYGQHCDKHKCDQTAFHKHLLCKSNEKRWKQGLPSIIKNGLVLIMFGPFIVKRRPLHKRGGLRDSWYQVYVKKKLFLCFDPRACKDIKVKGGDNLLDGHGCLEGYHSIDKLGSEG